MMIANKTYLVNDISGCNRRDPFSAVYTCLYPYSTSITTPVMVAYLNDLESSPLSRHTDIVDLTA